MFYPSGRTFTGGVYMASTRAVNQSVKLTKLAVDRAPLPPAGQLILRDAELKGFGLRVTAGGAKSFIVEKRIKGRVRRYTVGRYPGITAEQARKLAQKLLGEIISGRDPQAERKAEQLRGVTLAQAFADFRKARKNLKPRTVYDYERHLVACFPDWLSRPIPLLTKDMIAKRHRDIGENNGKAYANGAMRVLRAVLNFARAEYEDPSGHPIILENPVARLTHTRAWYRINRRQTVIRSHQLPAWYQAVSALKAGHLGVKTPLTQSVSYNGGKFVNGFDSVNGFEPLNGETRNGFNSLNGANSLNGVDPVKGKPPIKLNSAEIVADYLLLLLFTGLRRQEAATLKWDNVDLLDRTLTIPDPKNHEPLTLPLSDFVHELLTERKAKAINEYVFPGTGVYGFLIEPRRHIERVIEASGVTFGLHDLRRTFITIAESLDIPAYAIKRLVNHKMTRDVTAGYIITDVERLRRPMQRITDFMVQCVRQMPSPIVVPLRQELLSSA
jgi:integrase